MSGKRQHTLPRFLLKGFVSRQQGDEIFSWVFKKGMAPFETNIRNIFVTKEFYGKEGELSADDGITALETRLSQVVEYLRRIEFTAAVNHEGIPDLLAHLVVRTKYLRDLFTDDAQFFTRKVSEIMNDPKFLMKLFKANPEAFVGAFEEKSGPMNRVQKRVFKKKPKGLLQRVPKEKSVELSSLLETMKGMVTKLCSPDEIRRAHINFLCKTSVSEFSRDVLSKLKWQLIRYPAGRLVLGDVGPIFYSVNKTKYKAIIEKSDVVGKAFLPISNSSLLFGSQGDGLLHWGTHELNETAAKCSLEQFISSDCQAEEKELVQLIGQNAELIRREKLEEIVLNKFA